MRAKLSIVQDRVSAYEKAGEHLWLHKVSGYYYVKKTFARYRIPSLNKSTKEKTKRLARAKADQMIADHLAHYLGKDASPMAARVGTPVSKVIDEVLENITPDRRAGLGDKGWGTQDNHAFYLGELRNEWGHWDINRITRQAWNEWLTGFRKRKSRKTFFDYAKHMNLVLRYAYENRRSTHLVTILDPDKTRKKTAAHVFTAKEIAALYKAMGEKTRDQFALSFECFMRLREMLYLEWDRVDLRTGVITLRPEDVKTGTKTGKGRSFVMSKGAHARLKARYALVTGRWVFPSPKNADRPEHQNKTAWGRAKRKAGIKTRARWHDLRHTALTWALLDSGADPLKVSEYSGVSMATIQRVYLHSTHEQTRSVASAVRIPVNQKGEKTMKSRVKSK